MFAKMLSDDQIERIQEASLRILERVGVHVPHTDMLARFADAGAKMDLKAQRVKIPSALVARSLEQAGKKFTLYGRDLKRQAAFGQGRRNYNSIAGEASWLERVGGQRRFAALDDVIAAARMGDAMPELTVVGAMADAHEIPVEYRCVEIMATMLKHTTKPITFWFHDRKSARFLLEMMTALRGDEQKAQQFPVCYPFLEPISPLRFPFHGIDLLYETARFNLPVPIGPMAQMGLSAPATIAGTLAQENAEILAGICITQLIRPGLPVCYGGICHAFDMATTQMIFGGPEQAIFGVAMTQLGKSYGLPVYINVGLTDAKRPDAQAGLEAGISLMLGAAAGADIFGHMGICGVDQASSLDMLAMQGEVIAFVESVMRTLEISDETLGLDAIAEVAERAGSFIEHEHTLRHFRRELWFPRLLDRNYYQEWLERGAAGLEDRCRERKERILAAHAGEPMPRELERTLDGIVAVAKKEL